MRYSLAPARDVEQLESARELFGEYIAWLDIAIASQGFAAELARFPGDYAPPAGDLLLARNEHGEWLGCVGLRPLDIPGACEMKRLYVREAARGAGIGHALAAAAVEQATASGYSDLLLDTLPYMTAAQAIYQTLGFRSIPPYWDNAVPGIVYFGKRLQPDRADA